MNKLKIGLYSWAVSAFLFLLRGLLIEARVGHYVTPCPYLPPGHFWGHQPQYEILIVFGAMMAAVGIFFLIWALVSRRRE